MATLWSWTVLLALAVVKPDNVAVSKIALFWLLTMFLTLALRSGARSIARRRVWYLQNALIIGPENQAKRDPAEDLAPPGVGHQRRRLRGGARRQIHAHEHQAPVGFRAGAGGRRISRSSFGASTSTG